MSSSAELFDQAKAFHASGRLAEALALFDALLQRHPDVPEVLAGRGEVLLSWEKLEPALACYDQVVLRKPDEAYGHFKRGIILQRLGRLDEALQSYDRAIARDAADAFAHYSKGTALGELGRLADAIASYDAALAARPDFAWAHSNKGVALQALKRHEEALVCFDRAMVLEPDQDVLRRNKAFCSLQLGHFEEGWRLYEARLRTGVPAGPALSGKPVWLGQGDLTGKSLLLHSEQGLGDVIQFCRYAALAEAGGATVTLAVPAVLIRLLRQSGLRAVDELAPGDDYDYHAALLSMPLAFRTDAGSIPARIPYLFAEPARVADWSQRLGRHGFKIGIAWQGDKASAMDPGRSIPLRHFAGLANIPGVRLISLQKNDGVEQLSDLGMKVEVLGDSFDAGPDAFVDSAAIMESLDLVITSDTAIAHLAGALGRPVWLALQHVPEWRWQLEREDSPWYPGMRLFRQRARGEWAPVFTEMQARLAALAGAPPVSR